MSRADGYRGRCVLAALTLLGSAACSEATTEQAGEPVSVLIAPERVNLAVDEVASLTAEAVDANRRSVRATFSWSSANPDIATVSSTGVVTGVGIGSTTVTATMGTLSATVPIIVHPVSLFISPGEMVMNAGGVDRFTARVVGVNGRLLTLPIEWSSANPAIAAVGKSDGVVSAVAAGSTTVAAVAGRSRATATVTVEPDSHLAQWASGASASTEYTSTEWSAAQATGAPNVIGCSDDVLAWASAEPSVDWLEVTYAQPVIPTKIHIYVNWAVGSIAKVEVKDIGGSYHVVYSATPTELACPSVLAISITNVTARVGAVRITVDQRARGDWTEIDAVRLIGYR
jgi:hypothetical protein